MNNALLYLGGLMITALAVLFAVPYFVDWNSYRGVFEEEASRVLGRDVRVGGAVNLHLLPAPYLGFEKVRISDTDAEGGTSIFRVESFTMWLSVPPLLRGVIEANQVELRRPVVQLAIDREGGGNWRSLAFNAGTLPLVPKDVALQSVKIVDGIVTISAPARGELAQFEAINGEFSAEALEGPFKFRGSLKWGGAERGVRLATARRDANGDIRFKASVDASETGNSYLLDGRLSDFSGRPHFDGELTAKISLAPEPPANHGSDKEAAAVKAPEAPPAVKAPAPTATATSPATSGSAPLDAAELQLIAPAVDAHGRPKFDLRAKLEGDGTGFRLDDVAVMLDQGGPPQLITGSANLVWAEKMRLDVSLASRWLDLDALVGASSDTIPLDAARGFFEGLAAALPTEAETNAVLEFDQLNLGGEAVSNVRLSASRTNGPLELKGLRANLPGSARLELDGVLTPGQKVPKLDGTLAVAGQSLLRFLGWGFRHKTIGEGRTDGPFALEGRFALGGNKIELTEAAAEFAGMPLSGDVKYDFGERKRIALSLQGRRIDAAQIRPGILGAGALQNLLLLGQPAAQAAAAPKEGASPSPASLPFDPASADLALKLRAAELVDGVRVLRDVELEMGIDRGVLSLPVLKFATPEGLVIEATGHAADIPSRARGAMRGLIEAPTAEATLAFLDLLDLEKDQRAGVERIAKLAPLRLAGSLDFTGEAEGAADLSLDGTVEGGRMTALVRLAGGQGSWRSEPIDISATLDAPGVERLLAASPPAHARAADTPTALKPGRVVLKAGGIPANGMLSLLQITSDDFSADYNGRVTMPAAGATDLAGTLAISARDARAALAIAGVRLGDGAAETALAGSVAVRSKDGALTLATDDLAVGASKVRGSLTLKDGEGGVRNVTADLDIDSASVSGLMTPILAQSQPAQPAVPPRSLSPAPAPAQARGAPQAAPGAAEFAPGLWPEQLFDLATVDGLAGRVTARVHALALEPGLTISDARLVAAIVPGAVKVESLEGSALGGRLTSRLDFDKAPAGVTLNGNLRIDVASGPKAPSPGDIAALSLEFQGHALSPAALIGDLRGKGEVALGDTTLSGMSPGAVTAVAEAALAGKGPTGGEALAQAVKSALKAGQLQLGKIVIPIEIGDGAMKLGKVKVESADGRSTFATAIELATMKIDSEWQIEPKVARPSNPAAERVLLPAVTIVYVGKLSELASLEPVVTTGALERELQVRKMERDVDELERLRKLDQTRARQEIERQKALDAERAKTAAPVPNAADPQQQQPPLPVPPAPARPSAALPPPAANGTAQAASGPADPAASDGATVDATVGEPLPGAEVAVPAEAAAPKPARKKRPAEEWRPFQTSPLAPF
jgi:uncharacterized protein involved in outer membrane biogenesis